jgi:hypothetical protein
MEKINIEVSIIYLYLFAHIHTMSGLFSSHLRIPYEVLVQILLNAGYRAAIRLALTSQEWCCMLLSDNLLWKRLYEREYRLIDMEREWLETYMHLLQRRRCIANLKKKYNSLTEEMNARWDGIDWLLALQHRICTERNWRNNRPTDVVELEDVKMNPEFMYKKHISKDKKKKKKKKSKFNLSEASLVLSSQSGIFLEDRSYHWAFIHIATPREARAIRHSCEDIDKDFNINISEDDMKRCWFGLSFGQYFQASGLVHDRETSQSIQATCLYIIGKERPYFKANTGYWTIAEPLNHLWYICREDITSKYSNIISIYSLRTKQEYKLMIDSGARHIIQCQTPRYVAILVLKSHPQIAFTLIWEMHIVGFAGESGLLTERLCAKGLLNGIDGSLRRYNRIDDDYFYASNASYEGIDVYESDVDSLDVDDQPRPEKFYVISFSTNINRYIQRTMPLANDTYDAYQYGNIDLNIVWSQDLYDYNILADNGYVFGRTEPNRWSLFKISTGECIISYNLRADRVKMRILSTLFVVELDDQEFLVDVLTGKVLYKLPKKQPFWSRTARCSHIIDYPPRDVNKFCIWSYSSVPIPKDMF